VTLAPSPVVVLLAGQVLEHGVDALELLLEVADHDVALGTRQGRPEARDGLQHVDAQRLERVDPPGLVGREDVGVLLGGDAVQVRLCELLEVGRGDRPT
jgi:hypothetical protein